MSDRDALIAALSPDTVIAPEHMAEALYLARQEAIRLTGDRDRLASLLETAQHGLWQLKEITAMMADPSANWTDDVLRQHVEHLAPMVAAIHAAAAPPVPGEPQGEET